jgi:hypothetical protein
MVRWQKKYQIIHHETTEKILVIDHELLKKKAK